MCGSETLTTVVSSTSMKVESITAMAMIHGLMWAGFCCVADAGDATGWESAGDTELAGKFCVSSDGIVRRTGTIYREVYTKRREAGHQVDRGCAGSDD